MDFGREHALRHRQLQVIPDPPRFGNRGFDVSSCGSSRVRLVPGSQVEGDEAVLPTDPLGHIGDDTICIATIGG